MKKRITVVIECETDKGDDYIHKAIRRGVYRGLDTTPYYVASPDKVSSIVIDVEDIKVCKDCGKPLDPVEIEINERANYGGICRQCYYKPKEKKVE